MANGNANRTSEAGAGMTDAEKRAMSDEMAELRQEIGRLTSMVSDMAGSRYQRLRDQASEMAGDVAYRGAALKDEAVARAGMLEEEMQRTVRDRPLTSVAIAAGVGYLVGLLSRSHR